MPLHETPGSVVVNAPGHAPYGTVCVDSSPCVVVLPAGRVLGGAVLVDGAAAVDPIEIEVRSDLRLLEVQAAAPEALQAIGIEPHATGRLRVVTSGGQFRIEGLPENWSGRLRSNDWTLVAAAVEGQKPALSWIELPEPREDVLVRLRRLAAIRGRVMRQDGRTPAAQASVAVAVADREQERIVAGRTNDRGEFALATPIEAAQILRLDVRVNTSSGLAGDWHFDRPPPHLDVGLLTMPGTRRITLAVIDGAGAAIVDAGARLEGAEVWQSPVGPEHEIAVEGPTAACALEVSAPGFQPVRVEISAAAADTAHTVRLQTSNRLVVRFLGHDGAPEPDVLAVLVAPAPILDLANGSTPRTRHLREGALERVSSRGAGEEWWLRPNQRGEIRITDLRPNVQLTLHAIPDGGAEVLTRDLGATSATGRMEHEVRVERQWLPLEIQVLDPGGNGVAGAEATLRAGADGISATVLHARADEAGRVRSQVSSRGPFLLQIAARGFRLLQVDGFLAPADGSCVLLHLEYERALDLTVIDAAGQALPGSCHVVRPGQDPIYGSEIGVGRFRFSSLPAGSWEAVVRVSGREYRQMIDADTPSARVIVPAHGWILPDLAGIDSDVEAFRLQLVPVAGGEPVALGFRTALDQPQPAPAGSYRATLYVWDKQAESWSAVFDPVYVTSEAGVVSRVAFSR